MIQHLKRAAIDCAQWDALLAASPNGTIYGLSWYLDVVSPGWEALVKVEAGRYVAVMPLPVRTKWGMRYLQQPSFTQQLGVFYVEALKIADWQAIGHWLQQRFRLVSSYAFNIANVELLANGPDLLGIPGARRETYCLDLNRPYEQLVAGYKANRRWRLNQSRRRSLYLEPTTDIDLLLELFADNTAHKIKGLIGEAYEYRLLRSLYAEASERGLTQMWQARTDSEGVVAMILLWVFNDQFIYIFSGATLAGKQYGAITRLLDEVFRRHAGQNLSFDFEALPLSNLVSFYSSFGSVPTPFYSITRNELPWPIRQAKRARMAFYQRFLNRS
jgi:hypothetical protein